MRILPDSCNAVLWLVFAGILAGFVGGIACGGAAERREELRRWTRVESVGQYSFEGEVMEDRDLSGLAFISKRFGLLGADEARDVQVVELSRETKTLRVLDTFSLIRSGSEIDIEGIAVDGDSYYIVGSHGLSKKQGKRQDNRFTIFRLKVDRATGMPGGRSTSNPVETTDLIDVLRADSILREHFAKPLQQRGLNIEGLAAKNGRLFIGFRAPNIDGHAFVMEIRAQDVFGQEMRPNYALHRLRLGAGLGIREMVPWGTSFLMIVGNAGSEPSEKYTTSEDYEADRPFFLFAWDGKGPDVHRIGRIPDGEGQPEAMTILDEAEDHMTVLILFDGPSQGRPTVYRIE